MNEPSWMITESDMFRKMHKKYSRDKKVCRVLESHLEMLREEEDPARQGDRKVGKLAGLYSLPITGSIRVLYEIDYKARQISLVTMGDHKEVYGHD